MKYFKSSSFIIFIILISLNTWGLCDIDYDTNKFNGDCLIEDKLDILLDETDISFLSDSDLKEVLNADPSLISKIKDTSKIPISSLSNPEVTKNLDPSQISQFSKDQIKAVTNWADLDATKVQGLGNKANQIPPEQMTLSLSDKLTADQKAICSQDQVTNLLTTVFTTGGTESDITDLNSFNDEFVSNALSELNPSLIDSVVNFFTTLFDSSEFGPDDNIGFTGGDLYANIGGYNSNFNIIDSSGEHTIEFDPLNGKIIIDNIHRVQGVENGILGEVFSADSIHHGTSTLTTGSNEFEATYDNIKNVYFFDSGFAFEEAENIVLTRHSPTAQPVSFIITNAKDIKLENDQLEISQADSIIIGDHAIATNSEHISIPFTYNYDKFDIQ